MILAGDIGGTKTYVALFEEIHGGLTMMRDGTYASREHASFEEIVEQFLAEEPGPEPEIGCFGVAGPVVDGRVQATNLPWTLEESVLAKQTGLPQVKLFNDLEAAAFGMLHLEPGETRILNRGKQRRGHIAVLAAGTGLGEAMLFWDGGRHHPIASEGGHCDFAPRNDVEIELLNYLRPKFGHVSYERIVSGDGIFQIYSFLRDTGKHAEPAWLAEELKTGDRNATIGRYGTEKREPICTAAMDLFAEVYGAEAGNLALKCLATAVYVGGGIAPKVLPVLERGRFLRAFTDKGRLSPILKNVEVHVALNPRASLLGAAHLGRRQLGGAE